MRQNVRIWSLGLQYSTMGLRYLALGLQYFKENFRNLSLVSQSQSQVVRSLTANFNYLTLSLQFLLRNQSSLRPKSNDVCLIVRQ